jgi:hypothetical protein
MSVYVDDFEVRADVPNGARVVKGVWSHMTADTTAELLAMADKIGMKRSWIQYPEKWNEHFDVTLSKKKLALAAGALAVTAREGVSGLVDRWNAAHPESPRPRFARVSAFPTAGLNIFTIYDAPLDYPGEFVLRRWIVEPGQPRAGEVLGTADTLEAIRALLPAGLAPLGRQAADEQQIVESWV